MIKVSIIIPVFKVPLEYLRECFNSLLAQTMQECEFIVVSDGAPEEECSICEDFAKNDHRFKFFKREHAGVSATRNYGIRQAQGEYITFVDADDWINSQTCQIVYDYAKKNDSDIVIWETILQYSNATQKTNYAQNSFNLFSNEQIENLIHIAIYPYSLEKSTVAFISCKLTKRNLILSNQINFPESLKYGEDRFFHIQSYLHSKKISYLKENLYHYRIHNFSVTRKYSPNAYYEYTKFISYLDVATQKKFSKSIDLEYIHCFFTSWPICYMNKNNAESYFSRMQNLKEIIKTNKFQTTLKRIDLRTFPLLIKIELILLKRGITFPIYLHGLKALLLRF